MEAYAGSMQSAHEYQGVFEVKCELRVQMDLRAHLEHDSPQVLHLLVKPNSFNAEVTSGTRQKRNANYPATKADTTTEASMTSSHDMKYASTVVPGKQLILSCTYSRSLRDMHLLNLE